MEERREQEGKEKQPGPPIIPHGREQLESSRIPLITV